MAGVSPVLRRPLSFVLALVIRVALLVAVSDGFVELMSRVAPTEDADIGSGLLAMLFLACAAFAVAAIDGYRRRFLPAAALWALVAGLTAVASELWTYVTIEQITLQDALDDLADLGPTWFLLVAVPALAGLGLGAMIGRGAHPTSSTTHPTPPTADPTSRWSSGSPYPR